MPVPLFDLRPQHASLDTELRAAFDRVLRSGHYIMGPELTGFETECAAYLGVKHALGISSGTDALLLAMMALDIGPGDEVLCPSFSFFATAGCVARLGATPVFVDSNLDDFNLCLADTARKITPRTKAIIPVHLFGQSADMDGVMAIANQHNLRVIEDAAQAFSTRYKGKSAGGIGDFGGYSFFPTKNLGALGDAGLLVTNDDTLAERARILRVHGMEPKYYHQFVGANFRLDALQAALLRVKLPHLDTYTAARQRNAAYYRAQLLPTSAIILPTANCQLSTSTHIWNQYTLRITGPGQRDALKAHLAALGIGTEIYYPLPLHAQKCFAHLPTDPTTLPNATRLSNEVLSLPIYPELPEAHRQQVVEGINSFQAQSLAQRQK
ncbi:MAG: DegT/DnrJ/EryC1/StrS family aminotransferase [Verrucomicrobiota bacterium]|nr:DegT/DnrJ/EryC1/StrS family aminotransferase [Verrucomicrobiota bacterium]